MGDEPADLHSVDLLALPIEVHRRAADHSATMRREMALVAASGEAADSPERLLQLARELADRYSGFGSDSDIVLQAAIANGESSVDLHYEVPDHVVAACIELNEVLDEVEEYCRNGDLVTLVSPPDVLAYRRWFLDQFITQVRDGAAPRPWTPPVNSNTQAAHDGSTSDVVIAVDEDLDLEGAARLRTVIAEHVAAGAERIVLDMQRCEFVDSVGMSLLLTTRSRLLQAGGQLTLLGLRPQPLSALRTAGVLGLLTS